LDHARFTLEEDRRVHTCGLELEGRVVVTVRVATLQGAGSSRYYTEQLPSYYLDGDEVPGGWWGRGGERLGLDGEIGEETFRAVMADGLPRRIRILGAADFPHGAGEMERRPLDRRDRLRRGHHRSRHGDGAANMGPAVLSALDDPSFPFKIVR